MDDINRVFFPLRSNIGWFQSAELQEKIANKVKQSILLYDEIYIEDGTLMVEVKPNGSSVLYAPPGRFPEDQRSIEYQRDLEPTDIPTTIDGIQLLTGKSIARFKIDFFKIFEGLEQSDFNFIKFILIKGQIPEEFDKIIKQETNEDKKQLKDLKMPMPLRDLIISNLNYDILFSALLQSAILLDSTHHQLIEKKCAYAPNLKRTESPASSAMRSFIEFPAPNFSKMTMSQVLELREENGWQDLRRAVTSIISTLQDNIEIFNDPVRLEKTINYECNSAIFNELKRLHPSGRDTVVDLALCGASFLPYVGMIPSAISAGKTLYKYLDERDNWTAFLMKLAEFH
ncbi:Uncharacterised protein [uncultured archaeon]|nr:Uncharacterised protein [uncultured archaeon]